MPKILLLVHVEETFRYLFDHKIEDMVVEIEKEEFDEVIHFTSNLNDDHPVYELHSLVNEEVDWAWGYEPEVFRHEPQEQEYVIESSGHDYTWVPPMLRANANRLRASQVILGGGHEGECLADMESVLDYLNIPYIKRRSFVY